MASLGSLLPLSKIKKGEQQILVEVISIEESALQEDAKLQDAPQVAVLATEDKDQWYTDIRNFLMHNAYPRPVCTSSAKRVF